MGMPENKRDFRPLLDQIKPKIMDENERKNILFEATKTYFKTKNKIKKELEIIWFFKIKNRTKIRVISSKYAGF